jgi:hypothetical protein
MEPFSLLWTGVGIVLGGIATGALGQLGSRIVSSFGRVGFEPRECGFFVEVETEDGRILKARFDPRRMYLDQALLPLRASGVLFNAKNEAISLLRFKVHFIGVKTTKSIYNTPRVFSEGASVGAFTVPANEQKDIEVYVDIARESMIQNYGETIPVLEAETGSGTKYSLPLSRASFLGPRLVVWSKDKRKPVFNLRSLNDG